MEKYYIAALMGIAGLGGVRMRRLLRFFEKAENIWAADAKEIYASGMVEYALAEEIDCYCRANEIMLLKEQWDKQLIYVCSFFDDDYPTLLREIHAPPLALFYRGKLPDVSDVCVALVGARRASAYGKNVADVLAREIALQGITVVSGAARGIDTAAHQGALSAENGKTIAVLGCGVDIVYPAENRKLLSEIAERGAVVSEYLPGTSPMPVFFPLRNRIISGMARGVVIVEAAEKSGSLITADFALEQGRDVFAVPGSIFAATYKGVHALLKDGAKLVSCAEDVLEEYLGVERNKSQTKQALPVMGEEERTVYGKLSDEQPQSIEELSVQTGMRVQTVAVILLHLQIKGLAWEMSGKKYVKKAR